MNIHIAFDIGQVGGGGNNFLDRLGNKLSEMGVLSGEQEADCILYNSHHNPEKVKRLYQKYPEKCFIHRVDGPMRLYNHRRDTRDDIVIDQNRIADGVVFQSEWSKSEMLKMYRPMSSKRSVTIMNGCDLFDNPHKRSGKIKIIATSMSSNVNKGFLVYRHIDHNLDFEKYDFSFVGNSPFKFRNIKLLGAKNYEEVIGLLVESDMYITASKNDPCSNSLVEALSVGLPCVALNSGGHPEVLRKGGVLFSGDSDVKDAIQKVSGKLDYYRGKIKMASLDEVTGQYLEFCNDCVKRKLQT